MIFICYEMQMIFILYNVINLLVCCERLMYVAGPYKTTVEKGTSHEHLET